MTTTRTSDWIRGNVLGLVAIFIALSGTAYAIDGPLPGQNQVGSEDIINGEVQTGDIGTGEVKNGDIGAFEINANNIAPDSLGSAKIAPRSVKNSDLGLGASSSNTIADGGIQGVDVKNNTLTGTQIDELALDLAVLQQRVGDACPAGQAIRAVAQNGAVTCETVGGGGGSSWLLAGNSGTTATDFLGTTDNQPLNLRVNDARGLRIESASDGTNESPNVIGGIADNQVTAGVHSATIGGGGRATAADPATANRVTDDAGTVGGGANNQAGDGAGTTSDRRFATGGGGVGNTARRIGSTVGGGISNAASGSQATVAGGDFNTASGLQATVPGGFANTAAGDRSLAAGRRANAKHAGAFVWADSNNFDFASTAQDQFNVRSTGGARLVSGIDGSGAPTSGLELPAGTSGWSTLVNGQPFDVRVNGARGLRIDPATDGVNQSPNVIGGIADNSVTAGVHSATIAGGGRSNAADPATANRVTDDRGTIGGGAGNQAGDAAGTTSDRRNATVAGGISNTASGNLATIGGGTSNSASGQSATIGGGGGNIAGGVDSTVPGGDNNTAGGDYSLAAGRRAKATHQGAFVWADSQFSDIASTAANQFIARASGRFFLQSDSTLDNQSGFINTSTGGFLSTGGTWTNASDENDKAGFADVSPSRILARVATLPVRTWHYKAEPDVEHIGPVAQDFYRAFGVGPDERHIASVDADGVALAAIKGLNAKLTRKLRAERRGRIEQQHRIARLEARLAAVERAGRSKAD
jgi:hypothetical protein